MKEILFKGKRKDNGQWVEGFYAEFTYDHVTRYYDVGVVPAIFEPMENAHVFGSYVGGLWHPVDPETVGQYVGMSDKNGVKIFEGDVVKYPTSHEARTVVFDEEMLEFEFNRWDPVENPNGDSLCCDGDEYEVIGNIHDDPDPKLMEVTHES